MQAKQKTYITSIIQIVIYVLSAVAVVVLALLGANVLVIKLVSGIIFILRPIAQNLYVKHKYKIQLDSAINNYPIKQKWDGMAQHVAYVMHSNTDIVILTIFTSLAEVSI